MMRFDDGSWQPAQPKPIGEEMCRRCLKFGCDCGVIVPELRQRSEEHGRRPAHATYGGPIAMARRYAKGLGLGARRMEGYRPGLLCRLYGEHATVSVSTCPGSDGGRTVHVGCCPLSAYWMPGR